MDYVFANEQGKHTILPKVRFFDLDTSKGKVRYVDSDLLNSRAEGLDPDPIKIANAKAAKREMERYGIRKDNDLLREISASGLKWVQKQGGPHYYLPDFLEPGDPAPDVIRYGDDKDFAEGLLLREDAPFTKAICSRLANYPCLDDELASQEERNLIAEEVEFAKADIAAKVFAFEIANNIPLDIPESVVNRCAEIFGNLWAIWALIRQIQLGSRWNTNRDSYRHAGRHCARKCPRFLRRILAITSPVRQTPAISSFLSAAS